MTQPADPTATETPDAEAQARRLERDLSEHRRRLELVRKAAHTVIFVLELDTLKVEWVNRTLADTLGYEDDALPAVDDGFLRTHLHPDDLARLPELLGRWRSASDDAVIDAEYRLRHRSGAWRTFLSRELVYTRAPDGTPTEVIGTLVDITLRREVQRMAARSSRLEAVARMAGGIALDFNNLLTVVLGSVALARDAINAGGDPGPHLDELQRVAEQAAGISRRLMGFARDQAPLPELVDLNVFLREHEQVLSRLVAATHATGVAPQLLIEPRPCFPIRIDPTQLTQILVALIARADERGGPVTLRAGRDVESRTTWLAVHDRGPIPSGIELTRPLSDLDLRGVDLGLVERVAQQHHGQLALVADASGSRAVLTFPASVELAPPAPRPPPPRPNTGALVVVAEDEPMVAELTRRILVHAGHRVKICKDGHEALEAVRQHHDEAALLITDIVMPRMSGLELVTQLTAELPDLPILLASGYPEDERRLNDAALADVAFLPKPFRARELLAAVSQLLDRHAARSAARARLEA